MIDAFRLTDPRMQALGQEPRQTTSNLGHLQKPSIQVHIFSARMLQLNFTLYKPLITEELIPNRAAFRKQC